MSFHHGLILLLLLNSIFVLPGLTQVDIVPGDYGDAPDELNAGYPPPFHNVIGKFPTRFVTVNSRYGLPGAHTINSNEEWLGEKISVEVGPQDTDDPDLIENFIDDDFDDGWVAGPCLSSTEMVANMYSVTLSFQVTVVADAPDTDRYINVLIDLDNDGRWSSPNSNAQQEWLVQDAVVVVPPGTSRTVTVGPVLLPDSPIGSWMRVSLTRTPVQTVFADDGTGWDGSGLFSHGEIEDYLFANLVAFAADAIRARDRAFRFAFDVEIMSARAAASAQVFTQSSSFLNARINTLSAAEINQFIQTAIEAQASAAMTAADAQTKMVEVEAHAYAVAQACAEVEAFASTYASICATCPCASVCASARAVADALAAICLQNRLAMDIAVQMVAAAMAEAQAQADAASAALAEAQAAASAFSQAFATAQARADAVAQARSNASADADALAAAASSALASANASAQALASALAAVCGRDAVAAAGAAADAQAAANAVANAFAIALARADANAAALAQALTNVSTSVDAVSVAKVAVDTAASAAASAQAAAQAAAYAMTSIDSAVQIAVTGSTSASEYIRALTQTQSMATASCNLLCCLPCLFELGLRGLIPFLGEFIPPFELTREIFPLLRVPRFKSNPLGWIVGGWYPDPCRMEGFIWNGVNWTGLPSLQGEISYARGINNEGIAVGAADAGNNQFQAVLWNQDSLVPLGNLGGPYSEAFDINNQNQVIGISLTPTENFHAFRWMEGEIVDLGTLGGPNSIALDINDIGMIVGAADTPSGGLHAAFWDVGADRPTDIGTLGGLNSIATALNENAQVVGYSEKVDGTIQGFLWESGEFKELNFMEGYNTFALGINEIGQIVGFAENGTGDQRALLWNDLEPIDLTAAFPDGAGSRLIEASDIGDDGVIVGLGEFTDPANHRQTYLFQYTPDSEVIIPTPTHTFTPVPTVTFTPTPIPELPTPTFTPESTATPTPSFPELPTATPIQELGVHVYDNPNDYSVPVAGFTDFDSLDNRSLTIYTPGGRTNARDWHIYVRRGLGGYKYLGRTNSGSNPFFEWRANSPFVSPEFINGPDFNSVYNFRMIRIDDKLGVDDFYNLKNPVGYNVEGGNPVSLSIPDNPDLDVGEIVVVDDLLGIRNLAPSMGESNTDTDRLDWPALQIAWNFGVDPNTVNEYHLYLSVDGGDFEFLGQTLSGLINYFWWTKNNEFRTNPKFSSGPESGHQYRFRVFLIPIEGSRQNLTSGILQYSLE